ncbi:helix-turn-helix transcriptional regulator [Paenibacillus sp. MBLB4367]|uniref:helix-turn-helix transcriptional regulator n=1 Tax=Paenibacillus sp. MBLB4367 TaxID=3384767 RepID=UPI00390833AF
MFWKVAASQRWRAWGRTTNFTACLEIFFAHLKLAPEPDGYVDRVTLPEKLGKGTVQRVKLRPGMEIIVADFRLRPVSPDTAESDTNADDIAYIKSGIGHMPTPGTRLGLSHDLCHLAFTQSIDESGFSGRSERVLFIEISMNADIFLDYMRNEDTDKMEHVQRLLGKNGSFLATRDGIDASSQLTIRQMLERWNKQTMRKMYLESKCIELVAINVHEHMFMQPSLAASFALRKSDVEKLYHAKDILLEHMECPPSLKQLSKMAGLNDYKLKAGFKKVFGTTVYGLLREKRLEQAKLLLEQEQLNVGEAACAVGYANPSHFAQAFKEKYGVNPSEVIPFDLGSR